MKPGNGAEPPPGPGTQKTNAAKLFDSAAFVNDK